MQWRTPVTAAFVGTVLCGGVSEPRGPATAAGTDAWNSVKYAISRNSVDSHIRFFRTLQFWTHPDYLESASAQGDLTMFDSDLTEWTEQPAKHVVHIHGDLAAPLQVGEHSEIVIGGSILSRGRIEADNIVAIHVQRDLEGIVACQGSAELWVGGDLRGEVLTGVPVMHLHVSGDFTGSIRPLAEPALLYIGIGGYAASSTLAAIAALNYTELQMSVAASDTRLGVYPLSTAHDGFLAVTGRTAPR